MSRCCHPAPDQSAAWTINPLPQTEVRRLKRNKEAPLLVYYCKGLTQSISPSSASDMAEGCSARSTVYPPLSLLRISHHCFARRSTSMQTAHSNRLPVPSQLCDYKEAQHLCEGGSMAAPRSLLTSVLTLSAPRVHTGALETLCWVGVMLDNCREKRMHMKGHMIWSQQHERKSMTVCTQRKCQVLSFLSHSTTFQRTQSSPQHLHNSFKHFLKRKTLHKSLPGDYSQPLSSWHLTNSSSLYGWCHFLFTNSKKDKIHPPSRHLHSKTILKLHETQHLLFHWSLLCITKKENSRFPIFYITFFVILHETNINMIDLWTDKILS